jgi:predicted amino acid racemase
VNAPRLVINLDKLHHNALTLTKELADHGISVTAVTKATQGSPEISAVLLRAGVTDLGDSRIENIESMRRARVPASMTLIRSPMLSQISRIVQHADISFNTELEVIHQLSEAAKRQRLTHGIVLMVELGDIREGIMPADLIEVTRQTLQLPNLKLKGIGTNLACRSGVVPDASNMADLDALAESIETTLNVKLDIVSGGNSANLDWATSPAPTGRINNLRLGESILLGMQPLTGKAIPGLHTDAVTFIAEAIESKTKPIQPWGQLGAAAFEDSAHSTAQDLPDTRCQTILAVGHQDTDPAGLSPPPGIEILPGASSDHLVIHANHRHLRVGDQLQFQLNYSALVRAMASPFVSKVMTTNNHTSATSAAQKDSRWTGARRALSKRRRRSTPQQPQPA